jgi:Type IV secretion system proteins
MIPFRRFAPAVALTCCFAVAAPTKADVPVIDVSALARWATQLQQGAQQLTTVIQTMRDIEDIPQSLISQVTGLLNVAIQNPLQEITGNLAGLMNGSGVGTCTGAANFLTMNRLQTATGGDFLGSWLNGGASITAGLQGCTQQMMQATQDRLNQMPQLLSEVQACHDQACATALGDRIQLETATINAQQQQAQLVMMQGQLQRWTAQDQILQKQRGDYEPVISGTSTVAPGGASLTPSIATPEAPVFSANGFGG